jgi:hypothetical protein
VLACWQLIMALDGNDSRVPYPKPKSLRQACRYRPEACVASDALTAHWREGRCGMAARAARRNGFGLVSQEAEQLRRSRRDAEDALIAHGVSSGGASARG